MTVQFGCCYNYALDQQGRPPGAPPTSPTPGKMSCLSIMVKEVEPATNPEWCKHVCLVPAPCMCSRRCCIA